MILNKKKETAKVIIFLHLAKTGGYTLNSIISKQYDDNYDIIKPFTTRIPWPEYLQEEEKKRLEVLSGHFHFGIHKQLPQKKFTYITLIRNPIERIISFYYYIRNYKIHPEHHIFNQISLYEFVTKERSFNKTLNQRTFNHQTRILSGTNNYDLKAAKKNLENYFSIVGISERFDETLYVMEKKLGWKIDSYKKKNVTPNRPSVQEISEEIIDTIKKKNQKDIELYQFANKLLDKHLQQLK